jgi:hypothetical protein
MSEPKLIFLGMLIPPDADAATVQEAIERANLERAEAAKKESEALARLFHLPDGTKADLS